MSHSSPRAIGEDKDGSQTEGKSLSEKRHMLTLKVFFLILDFASEISRANKSSQLQLQVWLKVTVYSLFLGTTQDLPWSSKGAPDQMAAKLFLGLDFMHSRGN